MRNSTNWQVVLAVCIMGLLITNVLVTLRLSVDLREHQLHSQRSQSLPCSAIPTQFVIKEPLCADQLLRAMNVTNVRILPSAMSNSPQKD